MENRINLYAGNSFRRRAYTRDLHTGDYLIGGGGLFYLQSIRASAVDEYAGSVWRLNRPLCHPILCRENEYFIGSDIFIYIDRNTIRGFI